MQRNRFSGTSSWCSSLGVVLYCGNTTASTRIMPSNSIRVVVLTIRSSPDCQPVITACGESGMKHEVATTLPRDRLAAHLPNQPNGRGKSSSPKATIDPGSAQVGKTVPSDPTRQPRRPTDPPSRSRASTAARSAPAIRQPSGPGKPAAITARQHPSDCRDAVVLAGHQFSLRMQIMSGSFSERVRAL